MVPNPAPTGKGATEGQHHPRYRKSCTRRFLSCHSHRTQTLQAGTFVYGGPKLFNCPPRDIQGTTGISTENIKKGLNKFVAKVQMSFQCHTQQLTYMPRLLHRGNNSHASLGQSKKCLWGEDLLGEKGTRLGWGGGRGATNDTSGSRGKVNTSSLFTSPRGSDA